MHLSICMSIALNFWLLRVGQLLLLDQLFQKRKRKDGAVRRSI